jgi:hypothetical protein
MGGTEKPHMDKNREIINGWSYDGVGLRKF